MPDIMVHKINSLNINHNNLNAKQKNNYYLSTSNHSENIPSSYFMHRNNFFNDEECDNTEEYLNLIFRFNNSSKINGINSHRPKFFNDKINLSSRFSTNESNESFDSVHKDKIKCNFLYESDFTPVH